MNIVFSLLYFTTFHSFIHLIRGSDKNPLAFNPDSLEVYIEAQPNSKNIQTITYPVLAACPAKNDEEKEMNENKSLDKKALFVREIYAEDVKLDDMIRCESNFELAVAVTSNSVLSKKSKIMHMLFGYEVYFQESDIPDDVVDYVRTSSFDGYETIYRKRTLYDVPFLGEDKLLQFVWLRRIKFQFYHLCWDVKSVNYSIYRSADKINVICNDDNLGKHFYEEVSVDLKKYYSTENQLIILNGFEIPKKACLSTPTGCLEKYNLLKPHYFQSSPSSIVSCSDLTTVPIWHEASKELLEFSEKFLTAISEITNRKLTVTSGSYETLSLKYKNPTTGENELKDIYLDKDKFRFSVPRIIYKIVSYQSHDCSDEEDLCWFDMVIVIHNEPIITGKKLCGENKCKDWGWQSLQYLSTEKKSFFAPKSPFIYCCELNPYLRELFDHKTDYLREDLNLRWFPYDYDKDKNQIVYENMQEKFEEKMRELFKL